MVLQFIQHIVNTFPPEGVGTRFYVSLLVMEVSEILVQEADQPDSVFDFPDPDELSREHGAQVDLALPDADAAAFSADIKQNQLRR